MNFAALADLSKRKHSDAVVLPFWKGKKNAEAAADLGKLKELVRGPVDAHDFTGKEGEVLFLYASGTPEKRVALLGLGEKDKLTTEKLRRAYSSLTKACRSKKLKDINLLLPEIETVTIDDLIRGVAEGLLLANYVFDKLKAHSIKDEPTVLLQKVTLVGAGPREIEIANTCLGICQGVYLARDLVNGNADDVTPQYLSHVAQTLAKKLRHVKTTVFDKKRIQKEKMGLLLAVNRGSHNDPAFIIMEYRGNPKSNDVTVVVGKGVTYDTGGLNLKPTGSMETMKCDMGGAAAAIGTIVAASTIGLKVNVTAVVPSTENSIGSRSYKPGDVYTAYSGKTVEISNTDAEGRLILADALSYVSAKMKPNRIIDFATLTGAIDIALGAEASGLMSNNDALADLLIRAGSDTFERVWRLPLYEEYKEQLKSDIADIKNSGGRSGGAITAAMFLKDFVGTVDWAHLDIASTAYLSEGRRYHPKHATGVGVRLMIDFLKHL